jgi:hypothetical protein
MSEAPQVWRNPFLAPPARADPLQSGPLLTASELVALHGAPKLAGKGPPAWITNPPPITADFRGSDAERRLNLEGYRSGDLLRTPGADIRIGWNGAPRVTLRAGYENGRSAGAVGPVLIPPAPPKVSVDDNMRVAAKHSPAWLLGMVPNKHPWDYKQRGRKYEALGNFNFGAVAGASGLPDAVSLRGAGWAQQRATTSRPSFGSPYLGTGSYGDDPVDQFWIEQGARYRR